MQLEPLWKEKIGNCKTCGASIRAIDGGRIYGRYYSECPNLECEMRKKRLLYDSNGRQVSRESIFIGSRE
jgi:hypothetical protein